MFNELYFFLFLQDTVIALQALSKYSVRTYDEFIDLDVVVTGSKGQVIGKHTITKDNTAVEKTIHNVRCTVESASHLDQTAFPAITVHFLAQGKFSLPSRSGFELA